MAEKEYRDGPVGVFAWALYNMKHGKAVKRIGWLGYWKIETPKKSPVRDVESWGYPNPPKQPPKQEIVMHCKDGKVIHMDSGCDSMLTAESMAADDWMILTDEQVAELDKVIASRCLAK